MTIIRALCYKKNDVLFLIHLKERVWFMAIGSVICKAYDLVADQRLIVGKDVDFAKNKIQSLFNSCGYGNVLTTLNYYTNIIDRANSVIFNYMDDAQKEQLLIDIHIAYLLLLTQEQYELDYQKIENSKSYLDKRIEYEQLLNNLQRYKSNDCFVFINHLTIQSTIPNYLKTPSITKNIIDPMNSFNGKRLYWVWASSLINAALSLIPSDFSNIQNALNIMDTISFYTGIISWALYYARFSIHLSLLLKNTIKGAWLTEDDKKSTYWNLSSYKRYKIQWDKRKFDLLNDFIWATGNLICYFWFIGSGTFGHLGSVLTIVLLAFDVSANILAYIEKSKLYDDELESFNKAIDESKNNEYLSTRLKDSKQQCERNWKYEEYKLYNDIGYSIGLLAAFALMTLPFLPITVPSLFILSLTGTILCFALTVLHDAIGEYIDIYKNEEFYKDIYIKRSVFLSLLTPIVLSSFVFLPLGSAFLVLCAYAALSTLSKSIIDEVVGTEFEAKESNNYKFCSDKKLSFFSKHNIDKNISHHDDRNEYNALCAYF